MKNLFVFALTLTLASPAFADMSKEEMHKLLEEIDTRQRNGGDYKALAYLEQKEKDKADVVRELLIYRRDADDKLMLLFTKPKSEEGKGYLRLDKDDFQDILQRRPEIAQDISGILAQRRVELAAARVELDAEARTSRMFTERGKILNAIKGFFGLEK